MPSEKAITNHIQPGCSEPAMVGAFVSMEKSYLPVWRRPRIKGYPLKCAQL
jgi:hypothetical protein